MVWAFLWKTELLIIEFIVRLDIKLRSAEHLLITCNFCWHEGQFVGLHTSLDMIFQNQDGFRMLHKIWVIFKEHNSMIGSWAGSLFVQTLFMLSLCSQWDSVIYSTTLRLHKYSRLDLVFYIWYISSFFLSIFCPSIYPYPEYTLVTWKSHSVSPTAHNHNYAGDYWAIVCSNTQ